MPLSTMPLSLACSTTATALLIVTAFLSAIAVAGEGWENAEAQKLPHKRFGKKEMFSDYEIPRPAQVDPKNTGIFTVGHHSVNLC